jgi:hypothetical protein
LISINVHAPSQEHEIQERTETSSSASFLGFYLKFDTKSPLSARLYYKKEDINFPLDDFNFPILNFPHLDNNVPTCPSYAVWVYQNVKLELAVCIQTFYNVTIFCVLNNQITESFHLIFKRVSEDIITLVKKFSVSCVQETRYGIGDYILVQSWLLLPCYVCTIDLYII